MADVLQLTKAARTADTRRQAAPSAAGAAAVAAAEAIAARVAADVAAQVAAGAARDVVAACAAAARAAGTASSTATAAVSAAAAAAAETAMQNALDAEVDVDFATATAVASVAFSLAVTGVDEESHEVAPTPWDTGTADAIITSAAASAMAAARVAMTISAAAAAAATAAIDAAALMAGQLHEHEHITEAASGLRDAVASHAADVADAVLQFSRGTQKGVDGPRAADGGPGATVPESAPGRQELGHPEWASMLTDPRLPAFLSGADEVRCESPRERGLLRDLSLARRMVLAVRDDEAGFEAAFDAAPVGLLIARVAAGRPAEVVHVNAAVSTLTGYPAIQLLADGCMRLTRGVLDVPSPRASTGGRPGRQQSEGQVQRWLQADGAEILVQVSTASAGTSTGGVQHLVCLVQPVMTQGS